MKYCFSLILIMVLMVVNVLPVAAQATPTPATVNPSSIQQTTAYQEGGMGQMCARSAALPRFLLPTNVTIPGAIIGAEGLLESAFGAINLIISPLQGFVDLARPVVDNIRGTKLCYEGIPSDEKDINSCRCIPAVTRNVASLCSNIKSPREKEVCIQCAEVKSNGDGGIWTAIGCVDFNLENFIRKTVFTFGIGLAGMLALLCILYAAFQIETSRANPEKIKKAQELLTSCIMGLILIIFSVFILRLIGVDILRIPGFGL